MATPMRLAVELQSFKSAAAGVAITSTRVANIARLTLCRLHFSIVIPKSLTGPEEKPAYHGVIPADREAGVAPPP
jgi:hypothetical protein